ncbi:hypothetical protein J9I26_003784 [Salmonella enterica]|nr:hypothetical protein [Salmonella enterica]
MNDITVFPAPAGINRNRSPHSSSSIRVPRASGDKPRRWCRRRASRQCSPRQRG